MPVNMYNFCLFNAVRIYGLSKISMVLLEVWLMLSAGKFVCYSFLKGLEVTLQCSYWNTCFRLYSLREIQQPLYLLHFSYFVWLWENRLARQLGTRFSLVHHKPFQAQTQLKNGPTRETALPFHSVICTVDTTYARREFRDKLLMRGRVCVQHQAIKF